METNLRIGDIVSLQRGTTYKSKLLGQEGPTLLGLGTIARHGGFKKSKLKTYGGLSPEKILVRPGDLYVSLKDLTQKAELLGAVAQVPNSISVGRLTQDTVKLVFKNTLIDADYLYWLLRTPHYRAYCYYNSTGTTNLGLSREDFLSYLVPEYSDERKTIIDTLNSIDQKTTLLRQQNATLEAMAQALFKSWFVDFDPVIDNALAAGRLLPEALAGKVARRRAVLESAKYAGLPEGVRGLFPDGFVFSEALGRWVPGGWEVGLSGSLIDIRDGTHASPKKSDTGRPLVTSRSIVSGTLDYSKTYLISEDDYHEVNKRSKVDTGDILLTMIGTVGNPYLVTQKNVDFAIKNVALFRTSLTPDFRLYFFQWLLSKATQNHLSSMKAGTTQKYVSLKVLRSLDVLIPSSRILNEFDKVASKWSQKLRENLNEIETLTRLRDVLLPELISGRLGV